MTRRLVELFASGAAARPLPARRLSVLTTRERETLRMPALGMSNSEIAAAMGVSPYTAKTHVSNVLTKLGLRDRDQAVITAHETRLVVAGRQENPRC
ncbi:response regulator transcription factor [Paractinoplanes globisporus]|uniref:Response regulator transcription factor n=1 Tax=Paractinoplanes globisporus TaxID=113565 RepID=A0ABW6WCJ8_9ACTN|nr:LuxR C-terminal-related transcriptional regulator [Actinoplanes globisporus]